ncbi:asparagine synthetase B family protein [Caenispirillum salinarum]|uniref:asparagine synthetase B family protein n=1 Tax=Caenispirillum salinarum TaxID=859058 RepID=UPI00384E2C58
MSGFCGWIGGPAVPDARGTLHAMLDTLPEPTDMIRQAFAGAAGAVGCAVHPAAGGFRAADGLAAVWDGSPWWRDEDLAATARAHGHAAALLGGWRRHGAGVLERLAGHVSVAVVDPATGRALAAIDRAGVQSLAYAETPGGGVVFGGTVDAVTAHPAVAAEGLSPQAFHDYLYFVDRVPAPETIRPGVRKLVPGECLVHEAGRTRIRRYWTMPYAPDRAADEATLAGRLRGTLGAAVRRAVADEAPHRVGAFLSGGLDSSTVAGLLADAIDGDRPARAFTIGFEDAAYDESAFARITADHFGLDHEVTAVRPADVAAVFDAVATAYDEPFGNSSAVPALLCAQRARAAGVDLLLAGDGGDELFAGNARYLKDRVFQPYARIPAVLRKALIEPVAGRLSRDSRVTLFRKTARYVAQARLPMPVRVTREGLLSHLPAEAVLAPDLLAEVDRAAPERLVADIWNAAETPSDLMRFMALDLRLTLADGDLRKVGRMCALAGVRVRYPMLDDDVMAFSATIPPELLCKGGRLRGFYKDAFAGVLPRAILDKPKHGFGLPYLEFLRTDPALNAMAREAIDDLKRENLFRPAFLDAEVEALTAPEAQGNGALSIAWDLVTLHRWLARRRDRPAGARAPVAGAAE